MLRDQANDYDMAWRTFQSLERLAAHRDDWATWAAGRGTHTLLMAVLDDPNALARIREVQQTFDGLQGVELHAPHFLHISLQTCGFGDELAVDLQRLQCAVAAVPRFDVVLGGVNAFHSALVLETHSGGRLLELRQALRSALGPALRAIDPYEGFLFHLTIAYFGRGAAVGTILERAAELRRQEIARVCVRDVSLVRLPTDQQTPFPMLDCVARMPLGA